MRGEAVACRISRRPSHAAWQNPLRRSTEGQVVLMGTSGVMQTQKAHRQGNNLDSGIFEVVALLAEVS